MVQSLASAAISIKQRTNIVDPLDPTDPSSFPQQQFHKPNQAGQGLACLTAVMGIKHSTLSAADNAPTVLPVSLHRLKIWFTLPISGSFVHRLPNSLTVFKVSNKVSNEWPSACEESVSVLVSFEKPLQFMRNNNNQVLVR